MRRRTCCIHVPLFPLAARLRSEPDLRDEALAIFEGNGSRAALVAATRRARHGGLKSGMTLSQSRTLLPRLTVRARDGECERAAQETLVETAARFSPRVEDAGDGIVYLDLTGTDRHFAGADPEASLARALLLAAESAGLPSWAGVASSKLAARVAAERPPTPKVVRPRQEARFLAPLPLQRLSPEAQTYETLRRWGLKTIGDLAALPANQVAARLGPLGQKLHELARGIDSSPLVPRPAPAVFHEGMELDWPLVSLEPFLFVGGAALERLCRRLESRGLACARLEMSLRLEPHGFHDRSILLPSPTRDTRTLLMLSRLDLEQSPPGAPVIGFTFTAHPDRPRESQLTLLGPVALSPEQLATTLGRLFALLGPDGVGSPRTADDHLPEGFRLVAFDPPTPPESPPETRGKGLLAIRVLRPPLPLQVDARLDAGTKLPHPTSIATIADESARRPSIRGKVRVASGPWKIEDGWWSEQPVDRDYWDVELSDGGVYRLFRERRTDTWFVDGIYD